ncbi:rRNA maturation RNase YbeY [Planctomycetota bacterium]
MIAVQFTENCAGRDFDLAEIEKLVKSICGRFDIESAGINIELMGDSQIRELNVRFLDRDTTTDVISFDLSEKGVDKESFDLAINAEMAVNQAELRGHSGQAELALYVTHGLLHHLGFNDDTPANAQKMHETEDEILKQFGYGVVYDKRC